MKRPSFQFYPGDWLRDTALRTCSAAARGLWIDMICYMHEGYPYGYLKVGDKVILPANLARMCGLTLQETEGCLTELREAGVFEVDENQVIFSRRMIRDENIRNARASGGKLGGNPSLKDNQKVNLPPNLPDATKVKQKPTPSSSSSSSPSIEEYPENLKTTEFQKAWTEYQDYRKNTRLKTLLPASQLKQLNRMSEWGHDIAIKMIEESIANGWQGIFEPKAGLAGTFNKPFVKPKAIPCL
jgi:hypothetical protein